MEITTILMIIFSLVLVLALILYFLPNIKKFSDKLKNKPIKKDKKAKKNKKDDYEDMVIYRGDANAEDNNVSLDAEQPQQELDRTAQLEKELDSIKNYLKIPPPESGMNGDTIPINTNPMQPNMGWDVGRNGNNNVPQWPFNNDSSNMQDYNRPLPSIDELYEEKLWDDDLAKRLYIDDQLGQKRMPYNPYLVKKEKSIKDELSNLSPEMKKILISDLLKKKND